MTHETNEQLIMQGTCPDCGAPMKAWSRAEIAEVKDDLGMDDTDDFLDCCDRCAVRYQPGGNHK